MKNRDQWVPSKYIIKNGKLVASHNSNELNVASQLMASRIARFYDDALKRYAKGKLLDLGCGKVPFYHIYKDYVTDNICVDWGNTLHKNKYLDFEWDITKKLPFDNNEFDTIILSDVLEHIPQPEKLWEEMARILALKGTIILNVPFYYWIHEQPHDYYRYTEFALKRFIEHSGLFLVQLHRIGGIPEILADIFAKLFKEIPVVGVALAIGIQRFVELFVNTSMGRKISIKTSKTFPLGYFLVAEKPDSNTHHIQ